MAQSLPIHVEYRSTTEPPPTPTGYLSTSFDENLPLIINGDENAMIKSRARQSVVMHNSYSRSNSISCSITTDDNGEAHCHQKKSSKSNDRKAAKRKLMIASVVCLLFLIGEFIGGYLSGSLAIMTDAAHLLSDFASFMISLFALWISSRPATKKLSFGWHRAEVMGALISILIIWVLTGVLVFEAIQRIINKSSKVDPVIMLITSGVGVVINIILGATLHGHGHSHGGGHGHSHGHEEPHTPFSMGSGEKEPLVTKSKMKKDLNVRAAFIHVIGDFVQSVGVFIAALIIYFRRDWMIVDPICTFLFSILVLITTLTILKDILIVLMEGTPKGLDFKGCLADLERINAVKGVHNLHVWSLTMGTAAMSVHLAIDESRSPQSVLKEASFLISKKYEITHTTIQVEQYSNQMDDCSLCKEPAD